MTATRPHELGDHARGLTPQLQPDGLTGLPAVHDESVAGRLAGKTVLTP